MITCAGCARPASADRRPLPELRAAVLARTWRRSQCVCGEPLPWTYIDRERRQIVAVETPTTFASWRSLEASRTAMLEAILVRGSPYLHEMDDLRFRIVFGLEELREKLVVWTHGLDDALVECVKLRAFARIPTLATEELFVDAVASDDTLVCQSSTEQVELPAVWVRDAERDRSSLAARFPELFRGGFVRATRYLSP